jgi:hypothetical protein
MYMSTSKKTERLIALLPPEMMTWLRERAASSGCSLAELVRRAIAVRMTETGSARFGFDLEDLGEEAAEQIQEAEAEKP